TVVSPHLCLFFFSSRRRHTRSKRDWSSDVCSSDLGLVYCGLLTISEALTETRPGHHEGNSGVSVKPPLPVSPAAQPRVCQEFLRSEERRVGKECRCGGGPMDERKSESGGECRSLRC